MLLDGAKQNTGRKEEHSPNEGFINESGLEFTDITSEVGREYIRFETSLKLDGDPLYLNVSDSGGHRLYTTKGWCYYVQPREGWAIRWKVKKGTPSFVK